MDNYQEQQQYTAETSTTPGAVPGTDPTAEQMQTLNQDPTSSPEDMAVLQERRAFETYVQSSGDKIPENFKDAGAWFDSLKEAQKQYTQGQQEIADLKQEYAKNNVANPNYNPAPEQAPQEEEVLTGTEELRIPSPTEQTEYVTGEGPVISEEDWSSWGMEVAVNGELSQDTREEIKTKGGFTDGMIDDFMSGQKAKMREAYAESTKVVGGKERLDNIFKWAAESLTYEEQLQINFGLSGPTSEVTLRGLNQMYEQAIGSEAKAKEPMTTPNMQPSSVTQTGYVGYKTKREFYADRNNPRFTTEPKFRQAVEQRMQRTDFNSLIN